MDLIKTFTVIACLFGIVVYTYVTYGTALRSSNALSSFSASRFGVIRDHVAYGIGHVFKWNTSGIFHNTPQVSNTTNNTWRSEDTTQDINGTANITAIVSTTPKIHSEKQFNQLTWYIRSGCAGRLGNQMLQYAALLCAAKRDKRRHGYIQSGDYMRLTTTFPNLSLPILNITMTNVSSARMRSLEQFGPSEWFKHLPSGNLSIGGYSTSHIYFTHVEKEIRKEYTFSKHIRQSVGSYFKNFTPRAWRKSNFARVGIHVRRGDRANEMAIRAGEVMHPAAYFHRAMDYFLKRLERVQFIVASDDIKWCEKNLNRTNVLFSGHNYVLDLAILTSCDHMIISTGTYGWWAGYLCKGTTLFYGVFPPNGTSRAKQYSNGRWIPPPRSRYNNWIAINV